MAGPRPSSLAGDLARLARGAGEFLGVRAVSPNRGLHTRRGVTEEETMTDLALGAAGDAFADVRG